MLGSTDTCYVLSFSVIMLNTGLHNPNVRDRPPFERFVSMNRGINNGSDLPEEQLRVRTLPSYWSSGSPTPLGHSQGGGHEGPPG